MTSFKFSQRYVLLGIAGATLFILWQMLLPGYILTLDMVWVPHMPFHWDATGFNNAQPVWWLISALSYLIPSWIVQKFLFVIFFFLLFFLPYRFLPYLESTSARLFASAVYALNPFVYERVLSGQWLVFFGYAMLPLFLGSLVEMSQEPNKRSALKLAGALTLVGLFSIHYLYLCVLVGVIWLGASVSLSFYQKDSKKGQQLARYAVLSFAVCSLVSAYWVLPAAMRQGRIETRFSVAHFDAFAAAPNGDVPVMLNVLGLGGFWGEGTAWNYYFLWPQQLLGFWIALGALLLLVVCGVVAGIRKRETRLFSILLLLTGVAAYITALGTSDTPLRAFNELLYAHMPFWEGLRDSQKLVGILALAYAVFAGIGFEVVLRRIRHLFRSYAADVALPFFFLIPAMLGVYQWGGFHHQLLPTDYPPEWYQAKTLLEQIPPGEKVLVLPWHGYLSLPFTNDLVVANPTTAFFGDKTIASKSIETGVVHDQETDPTYRKLDVLLSATTAPSTTALAYQLQTLGVTYVLSIANASTTGSQSWSDLALTHGVLDTLVGEDIITGRIVLRRLNFSK